MRVVILQPMYIPWMGYFGMMQQADKFIFHDDIEFVRKSWQRRNRIKTPEANGGIKWLPVSVEKNQGQNINEVKINNNTDWQKEHWKEIRKSYSEEPIPYGSDHAKYFEKYEEVVHDFYQKDWEYLSNLNIYTIKKLAEKIGVGDVEFLKTSNMDINGSKTERVINILKEVGADEYVSGPGAKDYLKAEMFKSNDINLYWHNFDHPTYSQPYGDFESHLSAIDFLFNVGPNTKQILREAEEGSLEKEV